MLNKNDLITGQISRLAFGGNGILRHENFVIFVPFTAPEDFLSCKIKEINKNYASGEIVEIIKPSTKRLEPLCPYFGSCGGCQLQHIAYKEQLVHKREVVEDALKKIAQLNHIDVRPVEPAKEQWSYRRHITLNLRPSLQGYEVGYVAADNYSLLCVEQCPIFTSKDNPIFKQIKEIARSLESGKENARVVIMKADYERFILLFHFKELPRNFDAVFSHSVSRPFLQGVIASSLRKVKSYGDVTITLPILDLNIASSPHAFVQNHPEQSLKIYDAIKNLAQAADARKALDLYCGIGITTLLMGRAGMPCLGIENNKEAIRLAAENAKINKIHNVRFIHGKVEDSLNSTQNVDFILANPPRTGMNEEVLQKLLKIAPENIVYVSCMPATLARDLKLLCQKYDILICQPYDMFPQTAHVEIFVHLTKKIK